MENKGTVERARTISDPYDASGLTWEQAWTMFLDISKKKGFRMKVQ